jgi:uncharacterized oxidoreductase
MSEDFQTILIIGATSGLGEAFARRFHAQGKKVIAAGRRLERLRALETELNGLATVQIDLEDIAGLPKKVSEILAAFPDIDTVIAMSGIMSHSSFADPSTSSDAAIVSEVTTNLTAPILLARYFVPHLLALKRPATFVLVGSGLSYIPVPIYPVYCPTKAGIHSFAVALRAQLVDSNVSVVEISPPYVDTALNLAHREKTFGKLGERGPQPMQLDDYMNITMRQLEEKVDGRPRKEIVTGSSEISQTAWRAAFDPILAARGVRG